jgi:23S rRNA pseudouridine955/2504/2580 synthase
MITVNGRKAKEDYRIKLNDVIEITHWADIENITHQKFDSTLGRPTTKPKLKPINLKQLIIYEDGNRIFWNKPAGVVIHPSTNHYKDACMNDYLEQYLGFEDDGNSETFKPSFCYRLDKDTSGILIAAKTYDALKHLNEMIRTRDEGIEKYYLAVVVGRPANQTIDAPLFK